MRWYYVATKIWFSFSLSGRIQDFPRGTRSQDMILPNFPKNCMKLKEFGRPGEGGAPRAP